MDGNNKYKFVASVTALFLTPFLILSGHFISGEAEIQARDTLRYLELRTMTGAGIVSDVLNLNYNLSRVAGSRVAGGVPALKKDLEARVRENPFIYSELALLSPAGAELGRYSAEKSPASGIKYSSSRVFEEAKRTKTPAGAVEYGEYTPPALLLAEPLLKDGKPVYYLTGRLSLAYLGEVVRMMGRNSSGNFGLVDVGGQIIADSMSMSIIKPGLSAPPEVAKMLAAAAAREAQSFSSEVHFRGRKLLVSVSNVAGSKWWVYEVMDAADLPARKPASGAWRVVISGVLLILMFGVISYRLALHWLRPAE